MAEKGKSYSSSDEEKSARETDVEKCRQKLQAFRPYRGKSKWYGGSTSDKHSAGTTGVVVERASKASVLIAAITAGDAEKSAHLVDSTPLRALNKLTSVSVNEGTFKVTPLLWAVIQSKKDVVQLLVDRGVDVDRQGYLENGDIVYTYTPLIRALDNHDEDTVAVLLGSGADPYLRVSGPRISEEEGGVVRYTTWLYPATRAIDTDNVEIVRMFMERYDPLTVYTRNQHTCLCFALNRHKLANQYEIIRCIISHGGKLCCGTGEESLTDKGICYYFKIRLRNSFSLEYTNEDVRFRCNFKSYEILSLVCQTDYAHLLSSVSKALKQYFRIFDRDKFKYGRYDFVCQKSRECFFYMMNLPENASPLKQICRVVIRNNMPCLNQASCLELPLPSKLQSYVGFLNEE